MRAWNDHQKGSGICYQAHVEPRHIGYLCAIVEGHEGLAVVRTKDQASGIVELWISQPMQATFEDFLRSMEKEIGVTVGPPCRQDLPEK